MKLKLTRKLKIVTLKNDGIFHLLKHAERHIKFDAMTAGHGIEAQTTEFFIR